MTDDAESQDRWKRWLTGSGVKVTGPYDRKYFRSIYFTDPDGLILEIATAGPGFGEISSGIVQPDPELTASGRDEAAIAAITWPSPVGEIDKAMKLRSLHHVTAIGNPGDFYEAALGLRLVKRTLNYDDLSVEHLFYANARAEPGSAITFFDYSPGSIRPGVVGRGTVHHIAFDCGGDESQLEWRRTLRSQGLAVTEVRDRVYFRSIYFHSPDGLLLELATSGPGFAVDEERSQLGGDLKLPDWLEAGRETIEAGLPTL